MDWMDENERNYAVWKKFWKKGPRDVDEREDHYKIRSRWLKEVMGGEKLIKCCICGSVFSEFNETESEGRWDTLWDFCPICGSDNGR